MRKVISFLFILLVFSSCKHRLSSAAYVQYTQDRKNGLKKTIKIDNWEYTLQYKPYDYIILMETKGKVNNIDFKKRLENLKGTAWFNISFKLNNDNISPMRYNLASKEEYNSRYNYFINEAVHSIRLLYDKDTLRPIGYLFENNFNLAPQETMVVGFQLPAGQDYPQKNMQLSYNDEVFRNGIIKTIYTSEDLKNIPNLIY